MYRYRRRHLKEDSENLDRWLISYADYMTLMFAVFVVLYAVSLVKQESLRTLSQSFSAMFSVPSESQIQEAYLSDGILEKQSNELLYGNGLLESKGKKLLDDESQLVNLEQKTLEGTPLSGIEAQLTANLSPLLEAGGADLSEDEEWLILNLSSSLLFSSGSAYPSANLEALAEVISESIRGSNNYIRVRGYTDSSPIGNEQFSSNWLLSATRANVVLEAMYKHGIDGRRLAVEAYGDNFAVADNATLEGRAKNRRVAIAISKWAAFQESQPIPDTPAAVEPEVVTEPAAIEQGEAFDNSGQIRVITLPGGGIRITTRQERDITDEGEIE